MSESRITLKRALALFGFLRECVETCRVCIETGKQSNDGENACTRCGGTRYILDADAKAGEMKAIYRLKFCRNCKTLFIYSPQIEGMSSEGTPFEPCSECGSDDVGGIIYEPVNIMLIANLRKSRG